MNKSITSVLGIGILSVGLLLAPKLQASLVVNYAVDPVSTFNLGNPGDGFNDTLALTGVAGGLILQDGISQIAPLNHLLWFVGNSPVPGGTPVNFSLSRNISLNAGGSTVIQQGVDTYYDYVNHMSITPGSPLIFSFAEGTVTVTPLGHERDALPGVNYMMPDATLDATFLFTAVPEPSTYVAGALLLLPFGASTLRILRKHRAA